MIKLASKTPEEQEHLPSLILSPADVSRITKSNLKGTNFSTEEYAEIAQLLEEISVLERTAETKLRAWQHAPEVVERISTEIQSGQQCARKRLHDIFLAEHTYPDGPQLLLMPSDAYAHGDSHRELSFRNSDLRNIAHVIGMVARFEQELETYLTRTDDLEEPERQAMIRNTLMHLHENKERLTKILTGYYDKRRRKE